MGWPKPRGRRFDRRRLLVSRVRTNFDQHITPDCHNMCANIFPTGLARLGRQTLEAMKEDMRVA